MKRIHKIIAGTTGALALVVVTAVTAAPGGSYGGCDGNGPGTMGGGHMGMMYGGMGPGMGRGMGPGAGYGGMGGGGFGMMSEQNVAQLKAHLAITAQQESAWQAFSEKAAEQEKLMQTTHEQHWQSANTATTAPAQMSLRIGYMTQHLAGMQAMNTALTGLYAVLTPEQRTLADQVLSHMGPRGQGRGMRG